MRKREKSGKERLVEHKKDIFLKKENSLEEQFDIYTVLL